MTEIRSDTHAMSADPTPKQIAQVLLRAQTIAIDQLSATCVQKAVVELFPGRDSRPFVAALVRKVPPTPPTGADDLQAFLKLRLQDLQEGIVDNGETDEGTRDLILLFQAVDRLMDESAARATVRQLIME